MPDTQKGPQQPPHPSPSNPPSPADVKDKANQVIGQAKEAAKPVVDQAKEAAKPVLDQVKQGADQLSQQAKEHYGNVREGALKGYRQAEGTIARNPTPSVLISFGVGFGLGVVLCSLLTKKEETWSEKYLPESLKDVPDQYDSLVASLKSLPKAVHQQLPKSISKYLS